MEAKKQRGLRKGYTTGACAAAASKAAATSFFTGKKLREVRITLPIGQVVSFPVHRCEVEKDRAVASIIKDAGDDPDVTNGAEIQAEVRSQESEVRNNKAFQFESQGSQFTVYGGNGIGIVTKPGLAIPIGEPAINPVPRKMIEEAVKEIFDFRFSVFDLKSAIVNRKSQIAVVISVPHGEEIAEKTMNARLGIVGGVSILGTTGIVEPVSLSAYRHSIACAVDVALASGCDEIVFSTGRSSEKIAEDVLKLSEEAFVLVGDHMGFALQEVAMRKSPSPFPLPRGERGRGEGGRFQKITIVGQFGKFSKLAAGHFETHCSDSNVELEFLAGLAAEAGAKKHVIEDIKNANTARQVFFILKEHGLESVFKIVCRKAKENSQKIVQGKAEIGCMLIGYSNEVVEKL